MKKDIIIAASVLTILASCSKEIIVPETIGAGKVFTVNATLVQDSDSRAALQNDGKVYWSEGDRISLTDENNNVDTYILTEGAGTEEGVFVIEGTATITGDNITAFYPATVDNAKKILPSSQIYSTTGTLDNALMYAAGTSIGGNIELDFSNVESVIKFVLKGDPSVKVKTIAISASQPISGNFTVTDGVVTVNSTEVYKNGVNLECGVEGVALSPEGTPFFIAVPAQNYTKLKLNIVTSDNKVEYKTSASLTTAVNEVKTITLNLNNFISPTNLSSTETANCYIVSSNGYYCIDADVKGNGIFSGNKNIINETAAITRQSTANILWETVNSATAPTQFSLIEDVVYSNGRIYFKTADTFSPGNALIAVKDNEGKILWSWHIWCTQTPSSVAMGSNDQVRIMDRNLGALNSTKGDAGSLGLYYDWGRKDPFMSSYSINEGNKVAKSKGLQQKLIEQGEETTYLGGNNSLAYSIENPTTRIIGNSDNGYSWFDSSAVDMLGLWGTSTYDTKTMYDPCPAGWKVPGKVGPNFNTFWSTLFNVSGAIQLGEKGTSVFDDINKGITISAPTTAGDVWMPCAGYYENTNNRISNTGSTVYYWDSFFYGGNAYSLYIKTVVGTNQVTNKACVIRPVSDNVIPTKSSLAGGYIASQNVNW